VISIFFAQFIHTNLIKEPTLGHAIFALTTSFAISFCLLYAVEYISNSIIHFNVHTYDKIKKLLAIIEEDKKKIKLLEDQKDYIDQQIVKLREELKRKD
jgi:hypothetical protein